jgi:O-antigen ligase
LASLNAILNSNSLKGNLCIFILLMFTLGYPLNAVIGPALGLGLAKTMQINALARGLYAGISSILLIILLSAKEVKVPQFPVLAFVFLIILSIRVLYDREIRHIPFSTDILVYGYLFGSIVIPAFAIAISTKYINISEFNKWLFYIILTSNLAVLLYLFSSNKSLNIFEERVSLFLTAENSKRPVHIINSITISYYGAILSIFSLVNLLIKRYLKLPRILLVFCLILGVFNLLLGASRGPLLIFLVFCILIYIKHLKISKLTPKYILISLLSYYMAFTAILFFVKDIEESFMFKRSTIFIEQRQKQQKEVRDYIWASAINQFKRSPAYGDKYIEEYDNFYPHNIFLEVLMSTGVLGGVFFYSFFLIVMYRVFIIYFYERYINYFPIAVLVLTTLGISATSGCLFQDPHLWLPMIFISSISFKPQSSPKHNNQI